MPSTLEALVILILAILPGALYTWALEREVGKWGIGLSDRVLRFVGMSAVFQVIFLYPAYRVFIEVVLLDSRNFESRDRFLEGMPLPWWAWLLPAAYVGVPIAIGTFAGVSVHRRPRVARILVGKDPAPRAWDRLFSPRPAGMLRAQLQDGSWIGGFFAETSYAAGYPEEPEDIYIEQVYEMRSDGTFVGPADPEDSPYVAHGALLRWDQVKFIEFFHLPRRRDEPEA